MNEPWSSSLEVVMMLLFVHAAVPIGALQELPSIAHLIQGWQPASVAILLTALCYLFLLFSEVNVSSPCGGSISIYM